MLIFEHFILESSAHLPSANLITAVNRRA